MEMIHISRALLLKFLTSNRAFFLVTLPLLLVFAGPRVGAWLRPPVTGFLIEQAEMVDGALFLSGVMFKERGRFAGVTVTGKLENGEEVHVPLAFVDSKTDHTANRPRGLQEWGPWRLTVAAPAPRRVVSVSIEASHWLPAFGIKYRWAEFGTQTELVTDYPITEVKP